MPLCNQTIKKGKRGVYGEWRFLVREAWWSKSDLMGYGTWDRRHDEQDQETRDKRQEPTKWTWSQA